VAVWASLTVEGEGGGRADARGPWGSPWACGGLADLTLTPPLWGGAGVPWRVGRADSGANRPKGP